MWTRCLLLLMFIYLSSAVNKEEGENDISHKGNKFNIENDIKRRILLRNSRIKRNERIRKSTRIKDKVLKYRRKLAEKIEEHDKTGKREKKKHSKKMKKKRKNGKRKKKTKRKNMKNKKKKRKHGRKNSKKRRKSKTKSRYYDEGGKYKTQNKKFSKWASDLKSMMAKVKTDSSCSCGLSAAKNKNNKIANKDRIVNGQEADVNKYPWIISMMDSSGFWYCGGSIISDQWILTAAHCVYDDSNADDMFVRVGDHDNSKEGDTKHAETFKVESFIYHNKYDPETTNNDIALLKLEKKIDFSKYAGTVAPVCLPDAPRKYYDKDVTVSGWGLLEDGGKAANKLMEVDLKVIWMNECRKEFKYDPSWITSRMLCTFAKGQDACQGDSGGPLVWYNDDKGRYEQVGVVSWGIGCASPKYPGIFVKLSHFLTWVLKKTQKSTFCSG